VMAIRLTAGQRVLISLFLGGYQFMGVSVVWRYQPSVPMALNRDWAIITVSDSG